MIGKVSNFGGPLSIFNKSSINNEIGIPGCLHLTGDSYISTVNSNDFLISNSDFCVEWYQYYTSSYNRHYRYIRWTITERRSTDINSASCCQASDLVLLYNGDIILWNESATCVGASESESAQSLVDNSSNTKWCKNNWGDSQYGFAQLVIDNIEPIQFDSYRYNTANDSDSRDPITWTIEGSIDNTNWILLSTVSNASITSDRSLDGVTASSPDFNADKPINMISIGDIFSIGLNNSDFIISSTTSNISFGFSNYIRKWNHIAVTRQSGTLSVYQNGVQKQITSFIDNIDSGVDDIKIGNGFDGFITDFRFTIGDNVYPISSTISYPILPISSLSDTKLLLVASSSSDYLLDSSILNKSVTASQVIWGPQNPFITPYFSDYGMILDLDAGNTQSYPGYGITWSSLNNDLYSTFYPHGGSSSISEIRHHGTIPLADGKFSYSINSHYSVNIDLSNNNGSSQYSNDFITAAQNIFNSGGGFQLSLVQVNDNTKYLNIYVTTLNTGTSSLFGGDLLSNGDSFDDDQDVSFTIKSNYPTYSDINNGKLIFNSDNGNYAYMPSFGTVSNFTINSWFKIKSFSDSIRRPSIISDVYSGSIPNVNFTLGFINSNNVLTGGFFNDDWLTPDGFIPTLNKWYNVSVTYDGKIIKLYRDGSLFSTFKTTLPAISNGDGIYICRRWDASDFIDGEVSRITMYNRSISSKEINSDYLNMAPRFSLGSVGFGNLSGMGNLGPNNYFSIPASEDWVIGTDDFCVEWFQYQTQASLPLFSRLFQIGDWPLHAIAVSIEDGTFLAWAGGESTHYGDFALSNYLNQWVHFVYLRHNGAISVYQDGQRIINTSAPDSISNDTSPLQIGSGSGDGWNGYITNFRFVVGNSVYDDSSSTIVVPTNPLKDIPGTRLLLLTSSENTYNIDSSTFSRNVSDIGGVIWSPMSPFS